MGLGEFFTSNFFNSNGGAAAVVANGVEALGVQGAVVAGCCATADNCRLQITLA